MTDTLKEAVASAAEEGPETGTTLAQDMMKPAFLERIQRVLPATSRLTPERLVQAMLNEIAKSAANPRASLVNCTRSSIAGATLACAELGLPPGPLGLVYITARNRNAGNRQKPVWISEAQLQVGYKGYLKLCRNSGEVRDVDAWTVYEGDEFRFWRDEAGSHLVHVPCPEAERGDAVRWYMHAILLNGAPVIEVLERSDVERRMKMSQAWDSEYSPWQTNFDAMAKKSCFRAKMAWLPIDTETAERLAFDETIVEDRAGHLVATVPEPQEEDLEAEELRELKATMHQYVQALGLEDRADAIVEMTERFGPAQMLDIPKARAAVDFISAYRTNAAGGARAAEAPSAEGEAAGGEEDQPAEAEDTSPAGQERVQRIQILFGRLKVKDRDARLARINEIIAPAGPVTSSKDLNTTQAVKVISVLATEASELDPEGEETPAEAEAPAGEAAAPVGTPEGEADDGYFAGIWAQFEALVSDQLPEDVLRKAVGEVYDPGFTGALLNVALAERGMPTKGVDAAVRRRRLALALATERVDDPEKQLLKPFEELEDGKSKGAR